LGNLGCLAGAGRRHQHEAAAITDRVEDVLLELPDRERRRTHPASFAEVQSGFNFGLRRRKILV